MHLSGTTDRFKTEVSDGAQTQHDGFYGRQPKTFSGALLAEDVLPPRRRRHRRGGRGPRRGAAGALLPRIVEHTPHATSIDVPLLPDHPYPTSGSAMEERAWLQSAGATMAAVAAELFSRGMLHLMSSSIGLPIDAKGGTTGAGAVWSLLLDVLKSHGWAERRGDRWHLTDEGSPLAAAAPQYFYSVSYLPLAARSGSLIFPDLKPPKESDGGSVDRSLDIRFSGMVFERTCKKEFLELALPRFQQEPLEQQPAAVVDMGCGDGTMLIELFHAIREKTKRGQRLDERPLIMVGADYSSEALGTARRRMKERGIPGFCVPGDIGDPDALAKHLTTHGIDPHDVLHISKSVIHNRSYLHSSAPCPALPSATPPSRQDSASRTTEHSSPPTKIGPASSPGTYPTDKKSWCSAPSPRQRA